MTFIAQLNGYFDFVDNFDPETLFYAVLLFCWITFIWEYFLSFRQVFKDKFNKNASILYQLHPHSGLYHYFSCTASLIG